MSEFLKKSNEAAYIKAVQKLQELTIKKLKELIKAYNLHYSIKGYSKMTKSELIHSIASHHHISVDDNITTRQKQGHLFNYSIIPNEKKIKKK